MERLLGSSDGSAGHHGEELAVKATGFGLPLLANKAPESQLSTYRIHASLPKHETYTDNALKIGASVDLPTLSWGNERMQMDT